MLIIMFETAINRSTHGARVHAFSHALVIPSRWPPGKTDSETVFRGYFNSMINIDGLTEVIENCVSSWKYWSTGFSDFSLFWHATGASLVCVISGFKSSGILILRI